MKKLLATASVASALLVSTAIPAFAQDHNSIQIEGDNSGTINLSSTDNSVTTTDTINVNFDDVNNHWAKKYIMALVKEGILKGEGEGHFDPNGQLKRDAFATMVARYFHLQDTSSTSDFADVKTSDWFFNSVEAVKNYMPGYQFPSVSGSVYQNVYYFQPESPAERQDVATTLALLLNADGQLTLVSSDQANQILQSKFSIDADQIAPALRVYVASAVQAGLIAGDGNGKFRPTAGLSRGEAATLLYRVQNDMRVVAGTPVPAAPVAPAPAPVSQEVPPTPAPVPAVTPAAPAQAPAATAPAPAPVTAPVAAPAEVAPTVSTSSAFDINPFSSTDSAQWYQKKGHKYHRHQQQDDNQQD